MTGAAPQELDFLDNQPTEGVLLADRLAEGPLPPEEALAYAVEVGAALKKAHDRGLVHGALSPHTVRLSSRGAVIVRPTAQAIALAAAYRAPEQVRGEQPDSRSDVYAYGALLYEMAAGVPAFPGEGAELNQSILNDPPPTLTLRSPIYNAMANVIATCLDKNPGTRRQRVQNAVVELRFAAKGAGRAGAPRPPENAPVRRAVSPPAAAPVVIHPVENSAPASPAPAFEEAASPEPAGEQPKRAASVRPAKRRPAEPPPSDQFFFRPGEALQMRPEVQPVGILALFQQGGRFALSGFRMRIAGFIAICLLLVGGLTASVVVLLRPRHSAPVLKFAVNAPENTAFPGTPVLSPDGRNLAFSAQGPEGNRTLWLRPMDALKNSPINGTAGATSPFWAPDGNSLAYFAQQTLRIVRLKDYATEIVCPVEGTNGGGAWNRDNVILFSRGDEGLYKVAGKGASSPEPILRVRSEKGETGFLWPQFLPDGNHFIFFVQTETPDTTGVYGASLDNPNDYRLLMTSETNAVYSALPDAASQRSGYLLYISGRKLMGQTFNAAKMGLAGEPITLNDDIGAIRSQALAPISVASNATLVYLQVAAKPTRQLAWVDRRGNEITAIREAGDWGPPRVSQDGKRAIVARLTGDTESADLWAVDAHGTATQWTATAAHEGSPVWSPDGSKIASFVSGKDEGMYDVYVRQAEASSRPDLLFRSGFPKYPTDWSHDGRYIFFNASHQGNQYDVWAVSTADRHAGPILDSVNVERDAVLSPDGKWLAYGSDESGRLEVYVQPFTGIDNNAKRRWKVSTSGGALPKWRGDGKELFFITPSGRVMAAAVHPVGEGFDFEPPVKLFQTRPIPKGWNFFDVTPDGQRFLVNLPLEWASSSQINFVTNWTEKLKD